MSQATSTATTDTIVLKRQTWLNVVFFTVLPLLGAGLGFLLSFVPGWLTRLPDWVDNLPMIPGHEQFAMLDGLSGPWLTGILIVIGALAGVVLSVMTLTVPTWEISRDGLRIVQDNKTLLDVPLHHIHSLHPEENGQIIVLGTDTGVLARAEVEPSAAELKEAVGQFGLTWHDSDPFENDYVRWLDGDPELSDKVNAILRTRARAVEKGDEEDGASLSKALGAEGIVVRDRGERQQWRRTEI